MTTVLGFPPLLPDIHCALSSAISVASRSQSDKNMNTNKVKKSLLWNGRNLENYIVNVHKSQFDKMIIKANVVSQIDSPAYDASSVRGVLVEAIESTFTIDSRMYKNPKP